MKSKYTILIICEGENTEPYFFQSIRDEIKSGTYNIGDVEITIRPEPRVSIEEEESPQPSSHKATRPKLQLRKILKEDEPEEIKGVPPLKWVLEGEKELEDGTFNEVWAVFDHDNHPARKEAFEKASEVNVNIAFSSISFEYYLLLHFERIYKSFQKSECREKNKILNCNSGIHPNDCFGSHCIGGYARKNGYWMNSKDNSSLFPFIKDKLEIGFENSAWLRFLSEQVESGMPDYDRNPYVTTDAIVSRLTGIDNSWIWITLQKKYILDDIELIVTNDKQLQIRNIGPNTIILPQNSFIKVATETNQRHFFGEREILYPENSTGLKNEILINLEIVLPSIVNGWFILSYQKNKIMFSFETFLTQDN